jgi:hypothetical protein
LIINYNVVAILEIIVMYEVVPLMIIGGILYFKNNGLRIIPPAIPVEPLIIDVSIQKNDI